MLNLFCDYNRRAHVPTRASHMLPAFVRLGAAHTGDQHWGPRLLASRGCPERLVEGVFLKTLGATGAAYELNDPLGRMFGR